MKKGWQTKKLSEVSDVFDGPHATPKTVDSGPIFLGIGALQDGVINLGETRHVTDEDFKLWTRRIRPQPDDVVFSYETRLGQAAIVPEGLECCLGRRMGLVRFKSGTVDPRFFLFQYLSPQFREFLDSKTIRGATVDRFSIKEFPSFPIAVPPLAEQRRIVGILDETFAGIAAAKTHAEQNRQNARALFESHLHAVFTRRGPGWRALSLEDCIENVRYTPKIQRKDFLAEGRFPVVSQEAEFINGYWNNEPDVYRVSRSLVIFGDHTRVLKFIDFDFVLGADGVKILQPNADFDGKFFYYALVAAPVKHLGYARHYRLLAERTISIPSLVEQRRIVTQLDALSAETRRLESLYARKLAALDELKAALLHQAFSGQL